MLTNPFVIGDRIESSVYEECLEELLKGMPDSLKCLEVKLSRYIQLGMLYVVPKVVQNTIETMTTHFVIVER